VATPPTWTASLFHLTVTRSSGLCSARDSNIVWLVGLLQGVKKRCRLSYKSPNVGGVAGSQPMSTAVHRSPNKLWRSQDLETLYSFPNVFISLFWIERQLIKECRIVISWHEKEFGSHLTRFISCIFMVSIYGTEWFFLNSC
jgi:hypothetical protein